MDNLTVKNEILNLVRNLNPIERLNLLIEIWDEIKEAKELELISETEKQLLVNRLARYRKNPETAIDWKDLKEEVYNRYDQ